MIAGIHPAHAATITINIQNFAFTPQNLTLQSGDVVTWTNNDPVIYTLWFTNSSNGSTYLLSPPINPGTTWTHTFPDTVVLKYYDFDRLYITGRLTIVPILNADFGPVSSTNLTVTFRPTVSGGTGPFTFSWSFGDGTTSTSNSPSHFYQSYATYTVTLTVTDSSTPNALTTTKTHLLTLIFTVGSGGGGGARDYTL